jgi:TolB-like protein/Tfp pilus assembly protein PilF
MFGSLFSEMKRRNVFRVAAIYIVVSWLLIQVGDVMFPALHLPEWTTTMLVAFLLLGLPVALVLAWAYEVTPGGVVRTADVPPDQSITSATGQKINFIIIGVLAVAVVFLLAKDKIFESTVVVPEIIISDSSIAVLPFKNQSASAENAEFFAGGLHDELLTMLSRISDLKVISRTSVERLDPQLSIPEIGALLGVATILEGQVQRAGDRLRINVQLIDTAEEGHLWANTYDSRLTAENVFEVQGDIARTIADALHAELTPDDEKILAAVGTDNLEALDAYLLGLQVAKRNTYVALEEARNHLLRATELDPDYAEAWAELGHVFASQFDTGAINTEVFMASAKDAIEQALRLAPSLPKAIALQGIWLWRYGDVSAAEAAFRRAFELNPNDSRSLENYGQFLRSEGRPEEAVTVLERALELNPLSTDILFQLGKAHMYAGRPERFLQLSERMVEIDPASIYGYLGGLQSTMWMGRMDMAWPWYVRALAVDPGDYENWSFFAAVNEGLGDSELADRYLSRAESIGPGKPAVLMNRVIIHVLRGEQQAAYETAAAAFESGIDDRWGSDQVLLRAIRDHAFATGQYDEALHWYRLRRPELFESPRELHLGNYFVVPDLALLLQRAGRAVEAGEMLTETLAWYEDNIPDGVSGFDFGIIKPELLALSGQEAAALAEFQRAVDSGWRWNWRYYVGSGNLGVLEDGPVMQKIIEQFEAESLSQVEAIRALPDLGETDLRDRTEAAN